MFGTGRLSRTLKHLVLMLPSWLENDAASSTTASTPDAQFENTTGSLEELQELESIAIAPEDIVGDAEKHILPTALPKSLQKVHLHGVGGYDICALVDNLPKLHRLYMSGLAPQSAEQKAVEAICALKDIKFGMTIGTKWQLEHFMQHHSSLTFFCEAQEAIDDVVEEMWQVIGSDSGLSIWSRWLSRQCGNGE